MQLSFAETGIDSIEDIERMAFRVPGRPANPRWPHLGRREPEFFNDQRVQELRRWIGPAGARLRQGL